MALLIGRSLLRKRIREAGLNQKKLAKLVGLGEPFISMVISGERALSLERAVNVAKVLACPVEALNEWHEISLAEYKSQKGDE